MLGLREYQADCLVYVNEFLYNETRQDFKTGLCVLPTGSGKSHIIGAMKGLTVAPRIELVDQNNNKGANCMTINRAYLEKVSGDLLIIDEAHLVNKWGGMYTDVMSRFKKVVGFTATPYRLKTGHLVPDPFQTLIYEIGREELVEYDYLAERVYQKIPQNLLINVRTVLFKNRKKLSDQSCKYSKACLDYFFSRWNKKKTIIYVCDLEHARKVQEVCNIDIPIVSSLTPKEKRVCELNQFKMSNQHNLLINCELLTTGFDCPALSNVVILRPTESYSLYEQICGRGDRPNFGVNNIWDFTVSGFNWSVFDKEPNKEKYCVHCCELTDYRLGKCQHCDKPLIRGEVPIKVCRACQTENMSRVSFCKNCGEFIKKNVYFLKGKMSDIRLKYVTHNKTYDISFVTPKKIVNLYRQPQESSLTLLAKCQEYTYFYLYYKIDFFTSQLKIVKINFDNS